jgi:Winged helix-turn helix
LHVGLCGWALGHVHVCVDESQILALLVGEALSAEAASGAWFWFICRFVRSSNQEVGMNVRYRVELSQAERDELTAMLSKGKRAARKLKRAQILLAANAGCSDEEIARAVAVSGSTVYRAKRRFVEGNLERALSEEPRPGDSRPSWSLIPAIAIGTTRRRAPLTVCNPGSFVFA